MTQIQAWAAASVPRASTARALQAGTNTEDDPQYGFGRDANAFPPVKNAQVVNDGDVIRLGPLAVTACEACAKGCDACAAECEKFKDDAEMKACAKSCRDCAKVCREFIKHHG